MWGGPAAEDLIDVEGDDGVFWALWWWGHRWDGCGVPVAFVGGEGVQGGGDDVVGLPSRTMWRSVPTHLVGGLWGGR